MNPRSAPSSCDPAGDPFQRVLEALGDRVTRRGDGRAQARCPAHDDHKASLCVGRGDDSRALVYCQAGCQVEDVVAELGLTLCDLFPSGNGTGAGRFVSA